MMRNVAVVAEYNPFHRGHAWQLEKLKNSLGAESVLVLLSGDFVQRGEPAVADKFSRARMALLGGADLVAELPPAFATGSAEVFARGAVALAQAAGCVDTLAFGAPCADAAVLESLAAQEEENKDARDRLIREGLRRGLSYPAAVGAAWESLDPAGAALLRDPNNLLALEYIRALKAAGSPIRPLALERQGEAHAALKLPETGFASAGAIRRALAEGKTPDGLAAHLPEEARRLLTHPVFPDDLSAALSARLLELSEAGPEAFLPFADSSPELAARLMEQSPFLLSFTELAERLKTRAYAAARIRRFLLHILLNVRKEDQAKGPGALRILGLNPASPLAGEMKRTASLPVLTKMADAPPALAADYAFAHHRYAQLVWQKTGLVLTDDCRQSPVIFPEKP